MHAPLRLVALLPLTLLLGGCPIYLGDAHGGPDSDEDAGPKALECFAHVDCPSTDWCVEGTCAPRPEGACLSHLECPTSQRCEDERCVDLPAGACEDDWSCAAGERCVQDFCRAPEALCQFNYECGLTDEGAARACVDGGCGATCTTSDDCAASGTRCASGVCVPARGECVVDEECPAAQSCYLGRCLSECATSEDCALPGDLCDLDGRCRPDWTSRPVCASSDDCQAGSECVEGVCRVPCPEAPLSCVNIDVQLTHCAGSGYCETELERTPECAGAADCPAGSACVNATCRWL